PRAPMLLRPASELTPRPVEWLWPGYLAVGNLAILDGDPGQGKSLLTLDLAARLTNGSAWPDGAASPGPAPVILLSSEDPDGVIQTRLTAAGVHMPRMFPWPRVDGPPLPRIPTDMKVLDQVLAETTARLVIIDPIVAFLDRSVSCFSDASVR